MPKFYPNQAIIDDRVAANLYQRYKDLDSGILIKPIKTRKEFLSIQKSLTLLIEFKDVLWSASSVRDKAREHLDILIEKYNKDDYPELWV